MSKKISQLNELTSVLETDLLAVVNNGETKKVTKANLFQDINDALDDLNMLLSGKSNIGHIHDDRYYTETEIDDFLSSITGSIEIGGTIVGAIQGSVLFAGLGGVLAQDNFNLSFDDTNNVLKVKTLRVDNGTLSAPAYSFFNDPQTGFYIYTAGGMRYSANGNLAAQFNLAGIYANAFILDLNSADVGIARGGAATLKITDGSFGLGTLLAGGLDINSDILRLRTSKTPATSGASGNQGDMAWDSDYEYRCIATNSWKRIPLQTF